MGVSERHVAPKSSQLRPTQGEEQSGGARHTSARHLGGGADSPLSPALAHPILTTPPWAPGCCREKIPEAAHGFRGTGDMA